MRYQRLLLTLSLFTICAFAQDGAKTAAPQPQPKAQTADAAKPQLEPNRCFAYRIDDPKGEKCGLSCDTGQSAKCVGVPLESKDGPKCYCLKAQGLEGVMPWSSCHAVKKTKDGNEIIRCAIACDKRTVATCKDAPDEPEPGEPSCRCEPKSAAATPAKPASK